MIPSQEKANFRNEFFKDFNTKKTKAITRLINKFMKRLKSKKQFSRNVAQPISLQGFLEREREKMKERERKRKQEGM